MNAVDVPVGVDGIVALPDGRAVPVWQGGDPQGSPVLFHSGTPSGRLQALQVHEAAVAGGVRLISFNRPGYGTALTTPPGLASVGADGRALRQALGILSWGVVGISGGGPYAVATAAADGDGVTRTLVVAGIGPWAVLEGPQLFEEHRRWHEMAARGASDLAWAGLAEVAAREFGGLVDKSDEEIVGVYFEGAPPSDLVWLDATARGRWVLDARDALQRYDGWIRDNLSWAREWDVDLTRISSPVSLVFGELDPACPPQHGEWYAARLPHATMRVRDGAAHGAICFTGWVDHFAWLTA